MKTLTTIIAITFSLFTISTSAQVNFTSSDASVVKLNAAGGELKFEMGANGSVVKWSTSTESNTSHFELQVSNDNQNFETIRIVSASDVTAWSTNYQTKFIRNYMSAAKVYYRLKTVFTNGTELVSASTTFEITNGTSVSYANVH